MKKGLVGLVALAGCSYHQGDVYSVNPLKNEFTQQTSPENVNYYQGKTPFVVLLLGDRHSEVECQILHYQAIESNYDNVKFLAAEGLEGSKSIDFFADIDFVPTQFFSPLDVSMGKPISSEEIISMDSSQKDALYTEWFSTNTLPIGNWGNMWPIGADILFELKHTDREIKGIDNERYNDNADLYYNWAVDSESKIPSGFEVGYHYWAVTRRNAHFRNSLISYIKEEIDNPGEIIPVTVGRGHINFMQRALKIRQISYVTLLFDECGGPLNKRANPAK